VADKNLQEIKDRLNIAEVIGSYITVKKAGVNFKAACPFHHEKTPSLNISPQKQIWHCFGCGEGGDVFTFVQKYESLEFRDVVKILADKAGVKLPEYRPEDPMLQDEKELLLRINDFAARFYNKILSKDTAGKPALDYLQKRGLNLKTIEQWRIGYAPEDFHQLEKALLQKNVKREDLVKAGVSSKNERGQFYDRFRGRVTFPIYNYFGEIVGFSARILNADAKAAKYVNSPETPVYSKGKVLFGLNFAKEAIRKKDEVVIVEGQMDCISAHQAGFANTVASSGTALTKEQLVLLGRFTKNLKFCFDADTAGQAASRKAGEIALKEGFRLKVIVLEKVKDPDDLIKISPGLWEKAVSEAVWFLDQQMSIAEKLYASDLVEQKHYLSKEVVPLLSSVMDPLEQDHYVRKLIEKFSISERVIREEIKKTLPGKIPTQKPVLQSENGSSGSMLLEKEMLGAVLGFPDLRRQFLPEMEIEDFQDELARNIVGTLKQGQEVSPEMQDSALAKEAGFMVELELQEMGGETDAFYKQTTKSFAFFKLAALRRRQLELNSQIKHAEERGDKDATNQLNKKFAELVQLRGKYESQV
jgi:DNA primase